MTDLEALIFVHQEFYPATNHGAEAKRYVMRILKERMDHDKENKEGKNNDRDN